MKKQLLSIALSFCAVLFCTCLFNSSAYAATVTDGYLTFDTSTGAITECQTSASGKLVIPDNIGGVAVTRIGNFAFYYCSGLTSVSIPDSVTSIGNSAFSGCKGLTSIIIPDSVTSIGYSAFYYCRGLTSISIPDSVTSIGDSAFYGCSGLTSISIPDSVTSIGNSAFYDCNGLTSVIIPDSVTSIGSYAFSGCSGLTSVSISDGVTSIGSYAFRSCSGLTSVSIPDSVTSIGYEAFYGCSGLTSVSIPDSVTSIGYSAFRSCSGLTSVSIPDSVTSIGYDAFYNCSRLKSVIYNGTRAQFNNISGINNSGINKDNINYASYLILYDANGGSGAPDNQIKTYDITLTLSNTIPTRNGYTFLGWATDKTAKAAEYAPGSQYSNDNDITLYAVWNADSYTISYDANGGSGAPANQTKTHDNALTLSNTIPTRNGYTFLGWATDKNAKTADFKAGDQYNSDGDAILYAVWSANSYTIQYNANGGSGAPEDQTKTHDITLTLSNTIPTRSGYTFLGWATYKTAKAAEYKSGSQYSVEGNAILYAVWNADSYTISYDANGGSGAPANQTKIHDTFLTLSNIKPTRNGYTFLGWSKNSNSQTPEYNSGDIYTHDENIILYAVWKIKTYFITYDANGGTNAPGTQIKIHGENIDLSDQQPTRSLCEFLGWSFDKNSKAADFHPGDTYNTEGDTVLYAIWKCSPVIANEGGYLTENISEYSKIILRTPGIDTKIYYTTDGSIPTVNSTLYNSQDPPLITRAMTIKAIAIAENSIESDIEEFRFIKAEKPVLISLDEYAKDVIIKFSKPEGAKKITVQKYSDDEWNDVIFTQQDNIIQVSGLDSDEQYKFRIKCEFYNGELYSDEIIARTKISLSDECELIEMVNPRGGIIDNETSTVKGLRVTNQYTETELKLKISDGATWELYNTPSDAAFNRNPVNDKTISLEAGKVKTVYARITAQNGLNDRIYSISIYRQSKSSEPVFSNNTEYIFSGTKIALSAKGEIIKYTTDGSDPSHINGIVYTEPIEINKTVTIKAAAKEADKDEYSNIVTKKYNIRNPLLDGVHIEKRSENGKLTMVVSLDEKSNIAPSEICLYSVKYDNNNNVEKIKTGEKSIKDNSVSLSIDIPDGKYKLFLWDKNMRPLMMPEYFE